MPDNKNPPRNDSPQKPDGEEEKISRVGATIKCKNKRCKLPALSLSPYCWEHTKDKEEYRKKIQDWANAGKSMERFILNDADLSGTDLTDANLDKAWLLGAKLNWARIVKAKLSGASLINAELIETNLMFADLSGAYLNPAKLFFAKLINAKLSGALLLGAKLAGAKCWEADMSGTDLTGADLTTADLWGANLSGAKLGDAKLDSVLLRWANLTGAIYLTRKNFSKELTKLEKEKAEYFKGSYLTLKNYFIQSGLYDNASWAAFRERTLERIAWYNALKKMGLLKALRYREWRKTILKWFGSKIISLLNGYGERPLRVIISSVAIVMGFSLFYFFSKCIEANPPNGIHWWDYLYFSIVTFTTLGYGDIRPMSAPWARMVASGEAFIGAFMIALFVWTLARRYVAR